ncbi:SDR family oxidoreductase [Corynebacterium auriscanis]|uniref:SDR family oxidoreductase n=1 Tax=Corynebacterium auriscanis TaxID=99807 RepID=UPI003CE6EEAB
MSKLSAFLPQFASSAMPAVNDGIAVVTGASSGIGRAVAAALANPSSPDAPRFTVIGTSRHPENIENPLPNVEYLPLDLEDPASIDALAAEVLRRGTPAVLVNNAGESQSGPLEELPHEALTRLFQLNVLGQIQLTQKLLPAMRAAGAGRITMVGSMLGSFPLAFRSSYVASKAALKGFAFAGRREVRPFGVNISVMEPGSINTGLSARRTKYIDMEGPYRTEFSTMLRRLDRNESNGISAERVAEEILKSITDHRPRPLYATGSMAPIIFPLSRVLPRETVHWIIGRKHGL